MRSPPSMTSLSKALITLDGTLRLVDPSFELATRPRGGRRPVRPQTPTWGTCSKRSCALAPALRSLPEHIDELATQLRTGPHERQGRTVRRA